VSTPVVAMMTKSVYLVMPLVVTMMTPFLNH